MYVLGPNDDFVSNQWQILSDVAHEHEQIWLV